MEPAASEDHDMMMDDDNAPMNAATNNGINDDDNDVDDTPLFVGEGDAVEVQVDDNDVPMDEDEDDSDDEDAPQTPVVDMAQVTITSHQGPVYAVTCTLGGDNNNNNNTLQITSGGGDDTAFQHVVSLNAKDVPTSSMSLATYTDSVSALASNAPYIGFDTTKPPNPEWMAVGALDGSVVLYAPEDNDANKEQQKLEGPTADIEWLCWHPKGGNVLLVGSSDATIWMYHTTLQKCLQVFVGHEDAVTCGAFSADGKVVLSGSADGTLRIWAPKTGKSKHVFRFSTTPGGQAPAALTCLATHGGTDQQLILVGGEDGQAHVCHVANKKHITSLQHYEFPTNQHAMTDDEDDDDEVMLPSGVEAVGFCRSNPNWCATGGMDGVLKIWDLANHGQCRHACRLPPPREEQSATNNNTTNGPSGDGITKLAWHPTLPLVITATCRGEIHVWDARNGQRLQTLTGHADVINDMDVAFVVAVADGRGGHAMVVTASDDKTVKVFNVDVDDLLAHAAAAATTPANH